jgi:hypothetical protein
MPINPKKFREKVTNHFENITEEDFLKNLYKSSPYLFAKGTKKKDATNMSNSNLVDSNNLDLHCNITSNEISEDFKKIFKELPISESICAESMQDIVSFEGKIVLFILCIILLFYFFVIPANPNVFFIWKILQVVGLFIILDLFFLPLLFIGLSLLNKSLTKEWLDSSKLFNYAFERYSISSILIERSSLIDKSLEYREWVLAVYNLDLDYSLYTQAKQVLESAKNRIESSEKKILDKSILISFISFTIVIVALRRFEFIEFFAGSLKAVNRVTDENYSRNIAISLLYASILIIYRYRLIERQVNKLNQVKYCLSVIDEVIAIKGCTENDRKI